MLTVKEINEVSFGKAGFSGYKPEDVDNFIDEVAASFEELQAERDNALQQLHDLTQQNAALSAKVSELTARNGESQKKLSILAQKIESYRQDEEGIKEAIISAQRMGKEAVQQAKDKAAIMLQDAQDSAQKILDEAKEEASKTAGEYASQAESKKAELEEIKRQVSAFRVSLLEMYKKHLECIDHIPSFRQKDGETKPADTESAEEVAREQRLLEERQAQQKRKMEEEREAERQRQLEQQREAERQRQLEQQREAERQRQLEQQREAERQRQLEQQREAERQRQLEKQREAERQRQLEQQREAQRQALEDAPGLHDRVSYVQEQLQPSMPESDYMATEGLADVGIDLQTYSDIPESLRREKSTHYSNLEFGDNVEIAPKKGRKK